jgi:hypothetical protein
MALEPAVVLGLLCIEIVEDDVGGGVFIGGDDFVHEIEEFAAPPALLARRCLGGRASSISNRRGGLDLRRRERFRPSQPGLHRRLDLFEGADLDLPHALA